MAAHREQQARNLVWSPGETSEPGQGKPHVRARKMKQAPTLSTAQQTAPATRGGQATLLQTLSTKKLVKNKARNDNKID